MLRAKQAAIAAAALTLLAWEPAVAQGPLRVEIVGDAHEQMKPILVRITNLSDKTVQLALPMYVKRNGDSALGSEPVEVERRDGKRWTQAPLAMPGPRPWASPRVEPGRTAEFKFGIQGAGEYRIRVWYLISPGEAGPPVRPPKYASVVSESFRVN